MNVPHTFSTIRSSLALATTSLLAFLSSAPAEILFDNTSLSLASQTATALKNDHVASPFRTGAHPTTVRSVSFLVANPDSIPHRFTIRILKDNLGTPGSPVAVFDSIPQIAAQSLTPSFLTASDQGIILQPDSPYWIDFSTSESSASNPVIFPNTSTLPAGPVFSQSQGSLFLSSDSGLSYQNHAADTRLAFRFEGLQRSDPTPYHLQILAHSPAAYYRFEEASDATAAADDGPSGLHSISTPNTSFGAPGISGNAASFPGAASWINLPFILNPGAGADFSVEIWVRSSDFSSWPTDQIIVAQKDASGTGRSLIFHDSDATDQFANFFNNARRTGSRRVRISNDEWHHVVLSYRASDHALRWYIDGFPLGDGTPALSSKPESSLGGWVLGSHKLNTQQFFHGLLDEVAIYPYLLDDPDGDGDSSDSRIPEHYQSLVAPQPFRILSLSHSPDDGTSQLQWQSRYGFLYSILASPDLSSWSTLDSAIEPTGSATTWQTTAPPSDKLFFRIEESPTP